MGRRCSEIQDRLALAAFQKCPYGRNAYFQFQRGSDSVVRLIFIRLVCLPMSVEIDEAGRHNATGGVQDGTADKGLLGNGSDLAIANANMADSIESTFGIHHTSAGNNDIVLCWRLGREQRQR